MSLTTFDRQGTATLLVATLQVTKKHKHVHMTQNEAQ